jgi:hypothetical protein
MSWELGWRRASPEMNSPRWRYAGDGQSWPSGLHPGRGQAGENAGGTCNAPERTAWRIGARVGDPRGEGGSGHGGKGDAHAEGGRGDRNECGVFLTTPGCCNGSQGPKVGGAGAESWRRSGGAVPGPSGSTAALGHRRTLGEAVAAEGSTSERLG